MKNADQFARRSTLHMPPYIAGKPKEEVMQEYGLDNAVKLASNENPLKLPQCVVEAIAREAGNCYMYPEGSSPALREALAKKNRIQPEQIIVANGGDHVIGVICHAFVEENDEVIVGDPSFRTYTINTAIMGGKLVKVPLKNDTFDVDALLAAITPKTKLVFFCNPNNPTGTIVGRADVERFMRQVPDTCIVVFDEAYHEFVSDPEYPETLDYVRAGRNVIIIRTFSKIYGLAGLRVGYCIAPEGLAMAIGRVLPAFPVNRLAQAAALAALGATDFVEATLQNNEQGKQYLYASFDAMGLPYAKTHTNFIFVDVKAPGAQVCERLLKKGIIVRPCDQWNKPTYLRVTIGTPAENKLFIDALRSILQSMR